MLVALASERPPKVLAVKTVLERLCEIDPRRWSGTRLVTRATPSGVRDTPLGDEEIRAGALQRARALHERLSREDAPPRLTIGLEGGVHVEAHGLAWLRSWACVWDGAAPHWGVGPSVTLPPRIATPVIAGEDLAAVLDRVARATDARSRAGTWGFVTRDLLDRAHAFEDALVAALAPVYNAKAFALPATARSAGAET